MDEEDAKTLSWIIGTRKLTVARLKYCRDDMLKDPSGEYHGAFEDEIFRGLFLDIVQFVCGGKHLGTKCLWNRFHRVPSKVSMRCVL